MDRNAIKNLIAGFLVLAAVTGSATLIFSQLYSGTSGEPESIIEVSGENQLLPENNGGGDQGEFASNHLSPANVSGASLATDNPKLTENLTDALAKSFSTQFLTSNPNGPQVDASGEALVSVPTDITDLVLKTLQTTPLKLTADVSDSKLNIISKYNDEDIFTYLNSVRETVKQTIGSQEFALLVSKQPGPDTASAANIVFDQAVRNLEKMPVPAPFLPVQQSILSLFVNQRAAFASINNYSQDPFKTLLVLENDDEVIDNDLANIAANINNLKFVVRKSSEEKNRWYAIINNLIGVREAMAIPAEIVSNTSASEIMAAAKRALTEVNTAATTVATKSTAVTAHLSLAKQIKDYLYDTVLSAMINRIIDQIQNDLVNWVSGNGNPKFITNWKQFLTQSGKEAAGLAIQGIAPGLCRSFGPLVQVELQRSFLRPVRPISCTLDTVVNNLKGFYNNFQNGGWIAYGALALPNNNYFGALFESSQIVALRKKAAEEAAKSQAQASRGFRGVEICVKKHIVYDPGGPTYPGENPFENESSYKPVEVCDEYKIVTPGEAVAQALDLSFNAKVERIISAKRIADLVGALINASINRVIRLGLTAVSGGGNSNSGGNSNNLHVDFNKDPTKRVGGGGPSASSTSSTTGDEKTDILNQANDALQILQGTLAIDNRWAYDQPGVIDLLHQVSASCVELVADAQTKTNELINASSTVQTEIADLNGKITQLQDLIAKIQTLQPGGGNKKDDFGDSQIAYLNQLNALFDELNKNFDAVTLQTMRSTAERRRDDLAQLKQNAQINLGVPLNHSTTSSSTASSTPEGVCATPL